MAVMLLTPGGGGQAEVMAKADTWPSSQPISVRAAVWQIFGATFHSRLVQSAPLTEAERLRRCSTSLTELIERVSDTDKLNLTQIWMADRLLRYVTHRWKHVRQQTDKIPCNVQTDKIPCNVCCLGTPLLQTPPHPHPLTRPHPTPLSAPSFSTSAKVGGGGGGGGERKKKGKNRCVCGSCPIQS